MRQIIRNLYLFYLSQLYAWKEFFAYRIQAVFAMLYISVSPVLNYVFVTVIYSVSKGVNGWSYGEMLLLSAAAITVRSIVHYFMKMNYISNLFSSGELDVHLTKPVPVLLTLFSKFGDVTNLATVISSLILMGYAMSLLNFTLVGLLGFVLLILVGSAITMFFLLALILLSYKFFTIGWWINWFFSLLNKATSYPIGIYGIFGTIFLTVIVPLGLATYYPAAAISGKLSLVGYLALLLFGIAVIYVLKKIIESSLKSYSSGMG